MRIGNFCGIMKGVSVVVRLMLDISGKIALSGLVVLEVIVAGILVVQMSRRKKLVLLMDM